MLKNIDWSRGTVGYDYALRHCATNRACSGHNSQVTPGGIRRRLRTQEVDHHDTRYRATGRTGRHRNDVARARGARLENPRNVLRDSPIGRTLASRQRQLRDEYISGVNQHAYIRLIHRRFMLLVP